MAELGYGELLPGIYGTPNEAHDSDPIKRAALQASYDQAKIKAATAPGAVPWSYERLGGGNVAKIGWTAQNGTGAAFPPYSTEGIGRTPDYESDANPGGGAYDMNQTFGAEAPNPLNRAPIGDAFFDGMGGVPGNPSAPTTDVGGQIDLEW